MDRPDVKLPYYPVEDITKLGDGYVAEQIAAAVKQVAANILDENTDPTAAREIVIKLKYRPARERRSTLIMPTVNVKLAPQLGITIAASFGSDGKTLEARSDTQETLPGVQRNGGTGATLRAVNG
jgi:hypothetical protein